MSLDSTTDPSGPVTSGSPGGVDLDPATAIREFVRLGATREEGGGEGPGGFAILGPVGLGVDVAGTIRDSTGVLTFEHHAIPLPAGQFEPLPQLVGLILLFAIPEYLADHDDAGWRQIGADLLRPTSPIKQYQRPIHTK